VHSSAPTPALFTKFNLFDFYLFPNAKNVMKGTHFESVDEVKPKTAGLLNRVSADDLQHCFGEWKIRMEWCIDRGRVC
jgi:hypothetical protein